MEIDAQLLIDGEHDAGPCDGAEALLVDGQPVGAGRQRRDPILARGIRAGRDLQARVLIARVHDDGGGNGGLSLVLDTAKQGSGGGLRAQRRGDNQDCVRQKAQRFHCVCPNLHFGLF